MARFEPRFDQIEGLEMDLKKLGQLTDEDAWTILNPAGDFLRGKFMEKIKTVFQQHTGKLAASITSMRKKSGEGPYIQVYPYGTHHTYHGREKTRAYKRSKHGRTYTFGGGTRKASADEVAFVLEYGSSRIAATHWMENTINENLEELHEKMQEGFDRLCDEKGVGA